VISPVVFSLGSLFPTATPSGPFESYHRLYADDPSISFIFFQHVPPPGLAGNFLSYICNRERIHPSRASLYVPNSSQLQGSQSDTNLPHIVKVDESEKVKLRRGGVGFSEVLPLTVFLDVGPDLDRQGAAQPISTLKKSGKAAAKATTHAGAACGALGSCVAYTFSVIPGNFCGAFRSCWIDCWSCGNPDLYTRKEDNLLFCCCCWALPERETRPRNGRLQRRN